MPCHTDLWMLMFNVRAGLDLPRKGASAKASWFDYPDYPWGSGDLSPSQTSTVPRERRRTKANIA